MLKHHPLVNGSGLATHVIRCPALQVFGEITSRANVDYDAVARQVCHDIGYKSDVSCLWLAVSGGCTVLGMA